MPELPEVETVVRDLRPLLLKKRIANVKASNLALRRPWKRGWAKVVAGRRICEIGRRGKWIILGLDSDFQLLIHLGMTGQLRVLLSNEPIQDHTHLMFGLDRGGKQLRFRDVRRFGSVSLFSSKNALDEFFGTARLGPEPRDLELEYFRDKLKATARCLKAVLLDQQVVAGLGNIYADEALHTAKLHPKQLGNATKPNQARRLRDAVESVIEIAIRSRGSSIRDYVGGTGKKGNYQDEFLAYGRTGLPCRRCKTKIVRIRLAGRSTHFCPKCQRLG